MKLGLLATLAATLTLAAGCGTSQSRGVGLTSCPAATCPPVEHSVDTKLGAGTSGVTVFVEPDDGVKPVVDAINNAKHTILVSAYILSQHLIVRALERATAEGVSVYVLLEHHPFGLVGQPDSEFAKLAASGVHMHWAPDYFTYSHAKFIVLDDSSLLLSSANFSESGFASDRDFVVLDTSALDVREADNVFRADWDHIAPILNDANLLVSPSNARGKLAKLLSRARRSIEIYSEEVLDPAMVRLISSMARRGIVVRILATTVSSAARRSLRMAGAHIEASGENGLYIHAKAIVIDGKLAFIGSENLSTTSLDDNRELGVVVRNRHSIEKIEGAFRRDWAR